MSTLHQQTVSFNKNLVLSNNGGNLSNDAGLVLVAEFMQQLHFKRLIQENLQFKDQRKFYKYHKNHLFKQLLTQLIAGYFNDTAANTLTADLSFKLVLDNLVASQPTLSRFINQVSADELTGVTNLVTQLAQLVITQKKQHQLIMDLDSTHSDTFGHQDGSDFNTHYQTNGYHPLLAFDNFSGCLLGAKLRPGNEYTSKNAEDFLELLLKQYEALDLLVRADSGFAKPEIYAACEDAGAKFTIRLKANPKLQRIAEHLIRVGQPGENFTQKEVQWHRLTDYQPDTWERAYPVIVKSTRPAGELLFKHEFIVANLEITFASDVFEIYHQRGAMEDLIKEVKGGFDFDKTDSSNFTANQFRMLLASVAYNLIQAMKKLVLPAELSNATITTLRFKLFHLAGRVTQHARKLWLHLSSTNVFDSLYWQTLFRIQEFQLSSN
ncbi:IS1380 family transposase [Ligilactobacillus pobuzihii]|uniref:Transposase n=1 Tax=Ligilactobacillus pobuzihii TaxID=449659 RepID=A0A0R2LCD4_9LACO|nr:IS1380 family transposase [Ligilactobacillus pobuzihii]KRK11021.1 transposase [Ligilactobacillus pobuzihii E100301 = KCTC 13174]KRN99566.1 transposase [Ligilactobacillus pobuzihii]GEN48337.1 hypothetical protein LPO01_11290 [Ligilactobacillus pobuzihii]